MIIFFTVRPAPADEDEMMIAIFEAIDRMLNIVRPRKILYMAIDGVVSISVWNIILFICKLVTRSNLISKAPRAKMNQQRSRRFRATKETSEKIVEVNKIREKLLAEGAILPPAKEAGSHFDSNCITPVGRLFLFVSNQIILSSFLLTRILRNAGYSIYGPVIAVFALLRS